MIIRYAPNRPLPAYRYSAGRSSRAPTSLLAARGVTLPVPDGGRDPRHGNPSDTEDGVGRYLRLRSAW